jgi:hypothetical protein
MITISYSDRIRAGSLPMWGVFEVAEEDCRSDEVDSKR